MSCISSLSASFVLLMLWRKCLSYSDMLDIHLAGRLRMMAGERESEEAREAAVWLIVSSQKAAQQLTVDRPTFGPSPFRVDGITRLHCSHRMEMVNGTLQRVQRGFNLSPAFLW
eukprot:437583-Hanusia_phi.AAC.1